MVARKILYKGENFSIDQNLVIVIHGSVKSVDDMAEELKENAPELYEKVFIVKK